MVLQYKVAKIYVLYLSHRICTYFYQQIYNTSQLKSFFFIFFLQAALLRKLQLWQWVATLVAKYPIAISEN